MTIENMRVGISILDVGCGSGRAINLMARAYPSSRFTGYDFSAEAIDNARKEAAAKQIDNAHSQVKDVANLEQHDTYDLITAFDAIHDQARPAEVLQGIAKALKPDGVFLMQDIVRLELCSEESCASARTVLLHDFLYALHDSVTGSGWRRLGSDVGRGEGARDAEGCWFQARSGYVSSTRYSEHLLRRYKIGVGFPGSCFRKQPNEDRRFE